MNYKGLKDVKHFCLFCNKEIPFRNYRNSHKYCDNICQTKHRTQIQWERDKTLFAEGKLKYRRLIYKMLVNQNGNKCSICGITEWNNKPIRMWVDHIDGNAANNNPDNFRLVCPNCDSQSDTFGAKNKGSGRKVRGLKSY